MDKSSDESFLYRPLSDRFNRWSVPTVYGVCCVLICANLWEDYRRVRLAEDVARIVNDRKPATLEEWEALLADHLGERIRDYPSDDNPLHSFRGYHLSPRVWLILWVEYESESGAVVDTWMIYGGSEKVSLDAPREGIPKAPPYYVWLMAIIPPLSGVGIWLQVSRIMPLKGWGRMAMAFLGALPLLLYVPGAVISFLRITM
jgi:hypothetical protein